MAKEWMVKTLESFGLKRLDAEVYVYLVQHEPQKAKDLAKVLKTYKQQLYRSLEDLRLKGMVRVTQDRPASFSAVSFDEVLDSFIRANKEAARNIEQNRDQILSFWRSKVTEA